MTSSIQTVKSGLIEELRNQNFDFNSRGYLLDLSNPQITMCLALYVYGKSTATDIAKKTGLQRAYVSEILNQLLVHPNVKENEPVQRTTVGKKAFYKFKD